MCWLGTIENRHIARSDLSVFKILYKQKGKYFSPQYSEEYCLGQEIKADLGVKPSDPTYDEKEKTYKYRHYRIEEGLHCYSFNDCFVEDYAKAMVVFNHSSASTCFGSSIYDLVAKYPAVDKNGLKVVRVECTIPKGTVYWKNSKGEIVTSRLIPIKELSSRLLY